MFGLSGISTQHKTMKKINQFFIETLYQILGVQSLHYEFCVISISKLPHLNES